MSELGMAIGTAAGSIFGNLMGNKMQQEQFGNQLTLMKKQHEYNEDSANAAQERAYEMWEKTNYAAQIEQMKKAGLSPALMYGQAGAIGVQSGVNVTTGGTNTALGTNALYTSSTGTIS